MATTVAEHLARCEALLGAVLRAVGERSPDVVPVRAETALGRALAHDLASPVSLPRFDNSQMDGYAVRAEDLAGATTHEPVSLPIAPVVAAGGSVRRHDPGTATPIMTGAPIPAGAVAVIPIEQAIPPAFPAFSAPDSDGSHARAGEPGGSVEFTSQPAPGTFVRKRGVDIEAGAPLLPAGTRIGPVHIGLLAACSITEIAVRPQPRILIVTTGDELTDAAPSDEVSDASAGASNDAALIPDSNGPMLEAALIEAGATTTRIRTSDSPDELRDELRNRASDVDLVVTSGGISAGAFEVVRDVLESEGIEFGAIAMQPGGPQGLGITSAGTPVLAFPGNPVSTLLSAEIFLLPALRAYAGLSTERHAQDLPLAEATTSPEAKHQVRRGTILPDGTVQVTAPGSHLLHAYATANALVHIPVGIAELDAGDLVETWRIHD